MRLLQLQELIPVSTPLGDGYAVLVEHGECDYWWTVALSTGALVTFAQDRIRIKNDYTRRRGVDDDQMREIVKPKEELG